MSCLHREKKQERIIRRTQFAPCSSSGSHPTQPFVTSSMTLRFNALLRTLSGISGFHPHLKDLSQCARNPHMSNLEALKGFLLTIVVTSLRGYGPTNNISIIQIIQNFLPGGSPLPQFLPPTAVGIVTLSGPLIILRVCWRICLLSGEKDGKCCGHTTFSDLTSTPTISQMLRSRRQARKSMAWDQGLQPSNSLRVVI